jgi:hypothetical protein
MRNGSQKVIFLKTQNNSIVEHMESIFALNVNWISIVIFIVMVSILEMRIGSNPVRNSI